MWFLGSPALDPPRVNYQTLRFPEVDSKIYMTARVWGYTGDHEEVRLCTTPIEFKDTEVGHCIVFYTDEAFYRKVAANRLSIYVPASSVPKNLPVKLGQIEIEVHELKNSDDVTELKRNYEEHGLVSIAAQ